MESLFCLILILSSVLCAMTKAKSLHERRFRFKSSSGPHRFALLGSRVAHAEKEKRAKSRGQSYPRVDDLV